MYNIGLGPTMSWLKWLLDIESIIQHCSFSSTSLVKGARKSIIHQDLANTTCIAKSHTFVEHIQRSLCARVVSGTLPLHDHGHRSTRFSLSLPVFSFIFSLVSGNVGTQVLPDLTSLVSFMSRL